MLDYTKLELPAEVGARLLSHPALAFSGKFDHATGAVYSDEPAVAEYGPPVAIGRGKDPSDPRRALQFIVYPSGRTILHGSFHKYAQGGSNWGDFTYTQFLATVAELCDTFNLDPVSLRLLQLEAGANFIPALHTARTLDAIICHREGHAFTPMRSKGGRSLGRVMERDQYSVKVYDKGRQYQRPGDLLRFELKFTKARPFQRLNIYTLNDLLSQDAWQRLQDRVLAVYDELHIAEPSIDLPSLTVSQRSFIILTGAPSYWQELTKGVRYKARGRYADIVDRFAGRDLKGDLRHALATKLRDLLNPPSETAARGDVFTNIPPGHPDPAGRPFHSSVKVGTGPLAGAGELGAIVLPCNDGKQGYNKGDDPPGKQGVNTVRRCRTCGRDITDQRPGSVFCSEARHGKAAKRCRNAASNPAHNRMRSLERIEQEPLLFDHRAYIAPLNTGGYGRGVH